MMMEVEVSRDGLATKQGDRDIAASLPALKRFALFVDGVTRASLLSNGPYVMHQIVSGHMVVRLDTWSGAVVNVSWLLPSHIFGRWLGVGLSHRFRIARFIGPTWVARLGGVALVLSQAANRGGLGSIRGILISRFLSALLAGMLTDATDLIGLPEDFRTLREDPEETEDTDKLRKSFFSDLSSWSASLFTLGFIFSLAVQLIPPRHAEGGNDTFSPFWFITSAALLELLLRFIFSLCSSSDERIMLKMHSGRNRSGSSNRVTLELEPNACVAPALNKPSPFFGQSSSLRGRRESIDYPASVRSRKGSQASLDEFFDCRSVLSDLENVALFDDDCPVTHENRVAQYVNHRCVFDDGSAAYVPPGESPCIVPSSYLAFHNGQLSRAQDAWEETQRWRSEKSVWKIHTLPNPWFAKIKDAYPHFVHGQSKQGFPVIYEQPGRMELKRLFAEGCDVDDMLYHYTFFMEFIANMICTRDEIRAKLGTNPPPHSTSTWGIMVVMDVKGAGLSQLSGNVARYVKKAGDINSAHYPSSMKRAFLINAPFWLGGAWSGIKGILPDSVQVEILSERVYHAALLEYIDDDQIPPEYGGSSPHKLGEHPYEVELRNLVERVADAPTEDYRPTLVVCTSASDAGSSDDSQDQVPALLQSPTVTSTSSANGLIPLRRRIHSVDKIAKSIYSEESWKGHRKSSPLYQDYCRFALLIVINSGYHSLQAALELGIPIWLLSPRSFGGLAYTPFSCCALILAASFVVLWVSRSSVVDPVARHSRKHPLRVLRLTLVVESVLLGALAIVLLGTPEMERTFSSVLMTTIILSCSGLAFAASIGRSCSKSLFLSSCSVFPGRQSGLSAWLTKRYQASEFPRDLERIFVSEVLNTTAESFGILVASRVLCWSFASDMRTYFGASTILYCYAFVSLLLYASSFALPLREASSSTARRTCACVYRRGPGGCLPLLGEAVAVSTSDLASLMEEGHWSTTPILSRRPRGRAFSDTSIFPDSMSANRGDSRTSTLGVHKDN